MEDGHSTAAEPKLGHTIGISPSKGCESRGCGRLTPIVEHLSAAQQLMQSQGTGFKSLAQTSREPEIQFKKRLTATKRSPEIQLSSRVQQLSHELVESDSPKGLDRALTPAMLAVLRSHRTTTSLVPADEDAGD